MQNKNLAAALGYQKLRNHWATPTYCSMVVIFFQNFYFI